MKCTKQIFLNDVATHQMSIIRDEGMYRHVRFQTPGTRNMYFDLVTWPGYLCYTGDMGTYVFTRLHDMFEFFRSKPSEVGGLSINPSYWSEKCIAVDQACGLTEYSADKFRTRITEILEDAEASPELRNAVMDDVLSRADDGEHEARHAVNNFQYGEFRFHDFCEANLQEYTYRFMWCCYALAWGIKNYDTKHNSERPYDHGCRSVAAPTADKSRGNSPFSRPRRSLLRRGN